MDGHIPLNLCAHPACRSLQDRLHQQLHHLRHRRQQIGHKTDCQEPQPRPQGLQCRLCREPHIYGQEQPDRTRRLLHQHRDTANRPDSPQANDWRDLQALQPPSSQRYGYGLRRPALQHQHTLARLPRCAAEIPEPIQVHPRRRVPGHQLRTVSDSKEACRPFPEHLRGGRRRTEHLRLPRRQHTKHLQLQARLPCGKTLQA